MHPQRKKRLGLITFMVLGVGTAVGLMMYSLSQSINLFMTPTQIAAGEAPIGQTIRAGGLVVDGSVNRADDGLEVSFRVTDGAAEVEMNYDGILPDLFREGQGIVALGQINPAGVFIASEVLAKHDENYMPPEVQSALEQAHKEGVEKMQQEGASAVETQSGNSDAPYSYKSSQVVPETRMAPQQVINQRTGEQLLRQVAISASNQASDFSSLANVFIEVS